MIGNLLVLTTACFVTGYASKLLGDDGFGPGIVFFNEKGFVSTLGITIYCYEGIGIVMPVMAASE